MENLELEVSPAYFDEVTKEKFGIVLDEHCLNVNGLPVTLRGMPLLKNEVTGEIHLPIRTKYAIKIMVEEAERLGKGGVDLVPNPKTFGKKRYEYAKEFNFVYSSIDYEFIPGLERPWNTGFLTPVFFNLSVLNKFTQHPGYGLDLFSETYGSIWYKEDWRIEFGINRSGKVIMWLGDIDGLPDSDKYFLRSENIDSDHDIHSEFYDAQIEVQWSEASRQSALLKLRNQINDEVKQAFDIPLYVLQGEVENVIKNLHRPVFWEQKHVAPAIESLNRIFVESIAVAELKKDVKRIDPNVNLSNIGGLKTLSTWLSKRTAMESVNQVMMPFFVLYDFRILVCHLIPAERSEGMLTSINSRLGIAENNANYEAIYDALIDHLNSSYAEILKFVRMD
jgi:hypothetical protein